MPGLFWFVPFLRIVSGKTIRNSHSYAIDLCAAAIYLHISYVNTLNLVL